MNQPKTTVKTEVTKKPKIDESNRNQFERHKKRKK